VRLAKIHDAKVESTCRVPLCCLVAETGIELLVYPGWLLSLSASQPCQPSIAIKALTRRRSRQRVRVIRVLPGDAVDIRQVRVLIAVLAR
jgi:hypothetical protein